MDRTLDRALIAIADIGYRQVELLGEAPHLDDPSDGRTAARLRNRLESLGFLNTTVHAPLGRIVLGAPDETWRSEALDVLKRYIQLSARIAALGVVIHPVPNPCFVPDPQAPDKPARIREAVERSLDELVPIAARAGVRILLENLPYDCSYPFLNMTELRLLVEPYPRETLGLVVDVGHAWTSGIDPAEEILTAGQRLGGTHLQDVDAAEPADNHWAPTHGGLHWAAIRAALTRVDYAGSWTFEVMHSRTGETPEELATICRSLADDWGMA